MGGEPALHPRALARGEHQTACRQDEEGDEQRQQETAERRVERGGELAAVTGGSLEVARHGQVGRRGALGIEGRPEVELLARPRCGHPLEPPGAAELGGDRGVDALQHRARDGAVEGASRLARDLLERLPGRVRAADDDRVDERTGLPRRRHRLIKRGRARDVLAIGEQDDYACAAHFLRQHRGGEGESVVERRSGLGVHGHRAQRVVRVDRRGRKAGELDGVRPEDDHGDSIGARLGADELPGGGDRIVQLPSCHRPRAVDGDHDALRGSQVLSRQVEHALAVLGQRRRLARGDRRDDGRAQRRVPGRVDAAQVDVCARSHWCEKGDEGDGDEAADQADPPHSNPP